MTPESPQSVGKENIRIGLQAIEDILNDLRTQLDKLELSEGGLVCSECDAGMDLTLSQAPKEGWTRLTYAPDLPMADFVGVCPDCLEEESRPKEPISKPSTGLLFDTFPTHE